MESNIVNLTFSLMQLYGHVVVCGVSSSRTEHKNICDGRIYERVVGFG